MTRAVDRVRVVVLTALDLEYDAVRAYLTDVETMLHHAGTVFEVGRLRGTPLRIALAVAGEGNQAAAVLAERAVAAFAPGALFLVGIAGALRRDLSLGDVVVATRVYALHGGKEDASGLLARPCAWAAPHHLEQLARHVARSSWWRLALPPLPGPPCAVHFGPVAAGEVVLASRTGALTEHIRRHYNDAVAIEMESAGVAHAAHLNRAVPALTVRGISDRADEDKATTDAAGWQRTAACHAAAFSAALIECVAGTVTAGAGCPAQPTDLAGSADREPRTEGDTRPSSPGAATAGEERTVITLHASAAGESRVFQTAGDQYIYES
jgi:adenosylhomocysteine nucleosidase